MKTTAAPRTRLWRLCGLLILTLALLVLYRTTVSVHVPDEDSKDVVLYTTEWCPYCRSLRMYLEAYEIPYTEYDVEKSVAGMIGFSVLGGRGVPVSVIGPDIVYGYDLDRIERALGKIGYEVDWTGASEPRPTGRTRDARDERPSNRGASGNRPDSAPSSRVGG